MQRRRSLTDADYRQLLALRVGLRRFQHWSEEQAHAAGLTPAQHQLLLAVRGHTGSPAPSIGDIAEALLLRQHSATELVDRASEAGLVVRGSDASDRRVVRLSLTALGTRRLESLSLLHIDELGRLGQRFRPLIETLASMANPTSRA
jgi:DNA-binding MarR family transcriptional regulator